jgi:ketosteroid isomerase-like protein
MQSWALHAEHGRSAMPYATERVKAFFDEYEASLAGSDLAAITARYGESFVFSGPQGTQAVRRDDFAKVLPKRQAFFKSVGLRTSRVISLEETGFDDRCVLVKAQWRLQFEPAAAPLVHLDVSATYLLQHQADGLRIVFQLDHDDLTKRVQELGLIGNEPDRPSA